MRRLNSMGERTRAPRRMRLGWKITLWAIAAILGYAVLHVTVALRPDILFTSRQSAGNLNVYMRQPIPAELAPLVAEAQQRLAADPLYNPDTTYRVFIFNNRALAKYLLLRAIPFACNMPSGSTYIVQADVAADTVFCQLTGPGDNRVRTLRESIAHEITHDSIRQYLGWTAERALPQWIKEGYCECVADGCPLDGAYALSLVGSPARHSVPGFSVFRCRLMMAYLLYVEERGIEDILADPPAIAAVEQRFMADWQADRAGLLGRLHLPDEWVSGYLESVEAA